MRNLYNNKNERYIYNKKIYYYFFLFTAVSAYLNMSESDSDQEDSSERNANSSSRSPLHGRSTPQPPPHRKKACRKDKADSGIVEDAFNTGHDDESYTSDSDFANGTPVKHKRSNTSTSTARGNNNNNSGSSSNNGSGNNESSNKRSPLRRLDTSDNTYAGCTYTGHYVDTNAFSSYMKEKIHQLPLPHSLKLYINYNRNL